MEIKIGATEFWTTDELVKKTKLHSNTILRYIKSGKLKGKKVGRSYFITADSVSELFGAQLQTNP